MSDEELLRYFIKRTDARLEHLTRRVDAIWLWRVKMTGIWIGVSGLVSGVTTLITIYLHAHW